MTNSLKGQLFLLLTTTIFIFACITVCSAQVEQPTAACYHKELEEFAFLEGTWTVDARTRLADGKWEHTSATSEIKRDLVLKSNR